MRERPLRRTVPSHQRRPDAAVRGGITSERRYSSVDQVRSDGKEERTHVLEMRETRCSSHQGALHAYPGLLDL